MKRAKSGKGTNEGEDWRKCTISFPEDATDSYEGFQSLARSGMSDEAFAALIASAAFPMATESTRDLPLQERRWLVTDALPVIVRALGGIVFYEADVVPPDCETSILADR